MQGSDNACVDRHHSTSRPTSSVVCCCPPPPAHIGFRATQKQSSRSTRNAPSSDPFVDEGALDPHIAQLCKPLAPRLTSAGDALPFAPERPTPQPTILSHTQAAALERDRSSGRRRRPSLCASSAPARRRSASDSCSAQDISHRSLFRRDIAPSLVPSLRSRTAFCRGRRFARREGVASLPYMRTPGSRSCSMRARHPPRAHCRNAS